MAETNLNIILQLYDKATEGLDKVSNDLENFSRTIKSVGKEISQVGSTLAVTGAAITGPFALAFNNASKNVSSVKQSIIGLENAINNFQETIAKNIIPVVDRVTSVLNNLFNAFNSLSPELQSSIIQGVLWSGIFLTVGGTALAVGGKILGLVGNLGLLAAQFMAFAAANPVLLTIAVIILAIIAAMIKWKAVADAVLNTFEIMFLGIKIGFDGLVIAINGTILKILEGIDWVMQQVAKLPGPFGDAAQKISDSLQGTIESFRNSVEYASLDMQNSLGGISDIINTGTGQWAAGFDNLKLSISNAWQELTKGGTIAKTSADQFKKNWDGMKTAVGDLSTALTGYAAVNKEWALASQVVSIGVATMNIAQGVTKAFADYPWPVSLAIAGLVSAAGALQIATIASQKFETGTDSVPAMLTPGEMVFPRSMSDAIRSGDIAVSGRGGFDDRKQVINNISVTLYGTVVRDERDIDALTEAVSKRLAWEAERL